MLRTVFLSTLVVAAMSCLVSADVFSVDYESTLNASSLYGFSNGNPPITPSVHVPGAVFPLLLGDDLDAVSNGFDAVTKHDALFFSVDRTSQGLPGSAVAAQALLYQQASDIFVTSTSNQRTYTTPQGQNALHMNQDNLALQPLIDETIPNTGAQENLDAYSRDDLDLNGDRYPDIQVFFSLAAGSPSLSSPYGATAADILAYNPYSGMTGIAFTSTQLGLQATDDLDALAMYAVTTLTCKPAAYFSLAPNSPTLIAGGYSPADIFYTTFDGTFARVYTAAQLGLLETDNVDALETNAYSVPEPTTIAMLSLIGIGSTMLRRSHR
jgi:hypothetical protein